MTTKLHYKFVTTDLGIGDIICAMYALNGFLKKRGYPKATLYMRDHFFWPQMMDIPHLECVNIRDEFGPSLEFVEGKIRAVNGKVAEEDILRDEKGEITGLKVPHIAEDHRDAQGNIVRHTWDGIGQDKTKFDYCLGDSQEQYAAKLVEGPDWKLWYTKKLEGDEPVRPLPKADVFKRNQFKEGELGMTGNYVIFSPFATRPNRTWDVPRWAILGHYLRGMGVNAYVLDSPLQGERCKFIGCPYWFGQPPLWVVRAIMHSKLLVSNESGMAHLGGWLGVPTIVLAAQLNTDTQYSRTGITGMYSEANCVKCQFQASRGYEEVCNFTCAALQLISPKEVFEKAKSLMKLDPAEQKA